MSIPSQARALLTVLDARDFETMPPAERRRFADLCRHVARLADAAAAPHATLLREPKSGVLADLHKGARPE